MLLVRRCAALCVVGACGFHPGPARSALGDASAADVSPDVVRDSQASLPLLVQQKTAYAPSGSPLVATFDARPTAGDLLVMIGAANHGALADVSGGGATWSRATRSLDNANIEIWYGVSDGSSAAVTITFPSNPLSIWMAISEWSGMATSNLLDGASATSGTASPASAGTITTTTARDLVIFAVADSAPSTFGVPSQGPWSAMEAMTSAAIVQDEWYTVVDAPGTSDPQVTETAHAWDAAIAALRAGS